jgi:Family of unknown function (DUF5336)
MTYQYGSPNYYPTQSPAGYGAFTTAADQRTSRANLTIWIVVALGLATYVVSYAAAPQAGDGGWNVRFATAAAVVAALGLLRRQSAHTKVVATLAVLGFLEALSQLFIGVQNPGWATIAIVVLNALQASTAIAALLTQLRVSAADNRGLARSNAYAYYGQAAQQYYAANNQQPQQQQPAQGQATARAEATAQAQESAAQRYALYSEYLGAQQSRPNRPASSPQASGRTRTFQPASGAGMPRTGATESIQFDTEPTTESPAAPPGS